MDIQNQVQQNSNELQNFLKDMDSWEKDMKKKEEIFKLIHTAEDEEVPPIRNAVSKIKKKKHKKDKNNSPVKIDRTPTSNYQAWEKFDVESELKKLDEDQKESTTSDSSSSEEKLELQKRQQLAILKKDKGNDFFKKANYDSAINCYTSGMELDPENPLLPANRAMAFLKKEQYQAAENDCNLCILIDSTYVKAYLRRGSARVALKKFNAAKDDFLKALELEPDNKQAKIELDKIKGSIEEIEDTKVGDKKLIDNRPVELSSSGSKKNVEINLEDHLKGIENIISTLEQSLPPVPSASFQFLTDWKTLVKYPELKYKYLKQFPPENFPSIFKHSMEVELFPDIISILKTYSTEKEEIFRYMKYLSKVGRFRTMLMFLSKDEKKDLSEILHFIKDSNLPSLEVSEVIQSYKL